MLEFLIDDVKYDDEINEDGNEEESEDFSEDASETENFSENESEFFSEDEEEKEEDFSEDEEKTEEDISKEEESIVEDLKVETTVIEEDENKEGIIDQIKGRLQQAGHEIEHEMQEHGKDIFYGIALGTTLLSGITGETIEEYPAEKSYSMEEVFEISDEDEIGKRISAVLDTLEVFDDIKELEKHTAYIYSQLPTEYALAVEEELKRRCKNYR